jgi:hypothetical protein
MSMQPLAVNHITFVTELRYIIYTSHKEAVTYHKELKKFKRLHLGKTFLMDLSSPG